MSSTKSGSKIVFASLLCAMVALNAPLAEASLIVEYVNQTDNENGIDVYDEGEDRCVAIQHQLLMNNTLLIAALADNLSSPYVWEILEAVKDLLLPWQYMGFSMLIPK